MSARVIKGPSVGLNIAVFAVLLLLLMGTVLISRSRNAGAWNLLATVGDRQPQGTFDSVDLHASLFRPAIDLADRRGRSIWLAILFTLVASDYVTR